MKLAAGESLESHPDCLGDGCGLDRCGTYTCSVCHRTRPWCLGGSDELERDFGPLCDDCWCKVDGFLESGVS